MRSDLSSIGLSRGEVESIRGGLKSYPEIQQVTLFGSRAKGSAKRNSDIDLAVEGVEESLTIEKVAMSLDELPLPYQFDLQPMSKIRNIALRQHIERVGIVLYKVESA